MVFAALLTALPAALVSAVAVAGPPDPAAELPPDPVHIAIDPSQQQPVEPVYPVEPIADPVAPSPHHPPAAFMGVIGGGIVGAKDIKGPAYVGRFEVDAFPVFAPKDHPGAIVGFGYGFEYWRAGDNNWGLALPAGAQFGARVGAAHATVGFGIHALVVDQVNDDTGVGSWAPYASAQLGLHLGMFTAVVDGRIDHRWLAGAADRTQWSLGVMFGITEESRGALYR